MSTISEEFMMILRPARIACLAACLAAVPVFASTPEGNPSAEPGSIQQAIETAVPGLRTLRHNLLTAGQPETNAWSSLAERGVITVINLKPDAEMNGRDERTEVTAAGLTYHQIPVSGADDLNAENATRLWELVEGANGRVLVHCASGNRAGALLALGAAQHGGMTAEEALAFGQAAGLNSPALEAEVRNRLGTKKDGGN